MTPLPSSDARPAPVTGRAMRRSAAGSGAEGLVAERLRERKHRIRAIRRRVVALATAIFLASSGGILIQLVTGNDPALVKAAAAKEAKVASIAGKSSGSSSTAKVASTSGKSSGSSSKSTSRSRSKSSSSKTGASTSGGSSGSSSSATATAVTTSSS